MLQEGNSDREARFLAEFLKSFKGLRHLHLKLCNFLDLSWIEQGIAHHRSTLETLVYHERGLQAIDDEGRFEETRDQQPTWALHLANAVNLLQISALALCVSPSVMILNQPAERSSVQYSSRSLVPYPCDFYIFASAALRGCIEIFDTNSFLASHKHSRGAHMIPSQAAARITQHQ
ncbi:hypothetical protein N7466_011120 [Penicillium verhagenii]|uniref:uncharacterized protein n=1 Tax=Penicillium verhagenii TaxID=1562060 RepID=UPI002544F482|nr:uncharacterized protein N7466_011120 [Penicillium verhagenii]KAJ5917566.1 hypothetical protein N7466_011120 [Penicillium verhagenii]